MDKVCIGGFDEDEGDLVVGYGRFFPDQSIRDATFSKYWLPEELGRAWQLHSEHEYKPSLFLHFMFRPPTEHLSHYPYPTMHLIPFLLALFPLTAVAVLNGRCSGTATGLHKTQGICIKTTTCSQNGGVSISGGCPYDGADIKCCAKIYGCYGDESMCQYTNTACDGPFRTG